MMLRVGLAALAVAVMLCAVPGSGHANEPPDPVQIGLADSIFVDVPGPLREISMKLFGGLMKQLTGLNGKAAAAGDCYAIGGKLKEGKLHLGVFQGYEYAWALQKYPKLRPLMIAVYHDRHLRSSIVVQKNCNAAAFANLKGNKLALPMGTKGHGRLFLERNCDECAQCGSKAFFSQIERPDHGEAALDWLCDGFVDAALVDNVSLACYQQVKVGPFKRLRVLSQSEVFPAAVITYYDGALAEGTLNRFSKGMLDAVKNVRARDLMELFKITSFEPIPEDYTQTLANTLRAYPPPEAAAINGNKAVTGN